MSLCYCIEYSLACIYLIYALISGSLLLWTYHISHLISILTLGTWITNWSRISRNKQKLDTNISQDNNDSGQIVAKLYWDTIASHSDVSQFMHWNTAAQRWVHCGP